LQELIPQLNNEINYLTKETEDAVFTDAKSMETEKMQEIIK